MIDEQMFRETMDQAAATQDGLRARSLQEDLLAGRRRLRRNRLVGVGGSVVATAAVGAMVLGAVHLTGPDASPAPPVAGTSGTTTAERAGQDRPIETAPPPAWTPTPGKALPATGGQVQKLMLKVLAEHLDPHHQHLRVTGKEFSLDGLGGVRRMGGRVAYRIVGQPGEGYVGIGLAESTSAINPCGKGIDHPLTCREVTLPNGRKALLGRDGEYAAAYYVRPDGTVGTALVNPLFHNNTTIRLHDIPVTDAQLLAMVQDPRMVLPQLTQKEKDEKAKLTGFKPTREAIRQAAVRHLTGGTLKDTYFENVPEEIGLSLAWRGAGITQDVSVAVYSAVGGQRACVASFPKSRCERLVLPDGRVVLYGEMSETQATQGGDKVQRHGAAQPPRYWRGVSFLQPDGSTVVASMATDPANAGKGITKQQLIALATDPALDK